MTAFRKRSSFWLSVPESTYEAVRAEAERRNMSTDDLIDRVLDSWITALQQHREKGQ